MSLAGRILSNETLCLKLKLRLNFNATVSSSESHQGFLFTADGTFTTLPNMLNCPSQVFSRNRINGILGATSLSSSGVRSSYAGFLGNTLSLVVLHGGILLDFKYSKHVLRTQSCCSMLHLVRIICGTPVAKHTLPLNQDWKQH